MDGLSSVWRDIVVFFRTKVIDLISFNLVPNGYVLCPVLDLEGVEPMASLWDRHNVLLFSVGVLACTHNGQAPSWPRCRRVPGVDYPASIAGFLIGGSPADTSTLAGLVNTASTKCPSTQIVLSGYRSVTCSVPRGMTNNQKPRRTGRVQRCRTALH